MLRLNRLQEDGEMGRICALFDAERIGYQSYLAAFRVPAEYESQASYYIHGHPAVTQCVKRAGSFNFWLSILLPAEESLEFHLVSLKELSKAQKFLILKTETVYKPLARNSAEKTAVKDTEPLTAMERRLIRVMQDEFPLADQPYARIAKDAGTAEDLVLKQLQSFQKRGILKKITVLPAPGAKKKNSALLLWNVPEEKISRAGAAIAEFPEVIFCAKRAPSEELPYNLHVLAEEDAEKIPALIDRIETAVGMWPRQVLLKEKEEKRSRFKFFSKDIEDWRMLHDSQTAAFFSA